MRKGWKYLTRAIAVTAAVILPISLNSVTAEAIDLTQTCSMTISAGSFEDLANANVVYDIYKVADAVVMEGYDAYEYDLLDIYSGTDLAYIETNQVDIDTENGKQWRELAETASELILTNEESTIAPVQKAVAAGSKIDIDAGLYLVVAHTDGLEDYVETLTDEDGNPKVVTLAQSPTYVYRFQPELVSLPTRETINSPWEYDLTNASMKPEQSDRFNTLEITKVLDKYENSSNPTFVFNITAVDQFGKTVYDDVAGLTFDGTATKHIIIQNKIPVGATVTVTEVYSGASYTSTDGNTEQSSEMISPQEGILEFTFENTYNGKIIPEKGIVNKFKYTENANGDPTLTFDGNEGDNSSSEDVLSDTVSK